MMAVVLAEPMSSPATRRSGFIAVWRSPGHGSGGRARRRAAGAARGRASTGSMSPRRSSVTSGIARTGDGRRSATRSSSAPARAHCAEPRVQRRRFALHRAEQTTAARVSRARDDRQRRRGVRLGSSGSARPRSSTARKPAARRHERHRDALRRRCTTSVPGSRRVTVTRSTCGCAATRAASGVESDPRRDASCRRAAASSNVARRERSACRRSPRAARGRRRAARSTRGPQQRATRATHAARRRRRSASRQRDASRSTRRARLPRRSVTSPRSRRARASSSGPVARDVARADRQHDVARAHARRRARRRARSRAPAPRQRRARARASRRRSSVARHARHRLLARRIDLGEEHGVGARERLAELAREVARARVQVRLERGDDAGGPGTRARAAASVARDLGRVVRVVVDDRRRRRASPSRWKRRSTPPNAASPARIAVDRRAEREPAADRGERVAHVVHARARAARPRRASRRRTRP